MAKPEKPIKNFNTHNYNLQQLHSDVDTLIREILFSLELISKTAKDQSYPFVLINCKQQISFSSNKHHYNRNSAYKP